MADTIQKEKPLGLPPMQLAEKIGVDSKNRGSKKCFLIFKKVLSILTLSFVIFGTCLILFKFSFCSEKSTEIILVTGVKNTQNITFEQNGLEIYLRLKNKTSNVGLRRKKRNIAKAKLFHYKEKAPISLNDNDIIKARKTVMNYNEPCNNENKNEMCKELVRRIKSVSVDSLEKVQSENIENAHERINKDTALEDQALEPIAEPRATIEEENQMTPKIIHKEKTHIDTHAHSSYGHQHKLSDTCLLAKLLHRSYPQFNTEYSSMHHVPSPSHYSHYPEIGYPHSYPETYPYTRQAFDVPEGRPHHQDIDIFTRFHTTDVPNYLTRDFRPIECSPGFAACLNGQGCIAEKQWCDGVVHCIDASDEAKCECKSRVDKSRLCDGYFDCPSGEDEMGCLGCEENMFSCEDFDLTTQSTCFSKKQRCNGIVECPNQKDEIECNLLAPSLHEKPIFAVSNTEGFLQRNFKGSWYPVCKNPYMWAHDVCRRETGLIIRPPFIHSVNIDPMLRITYINTSPGGMLQLSDTCGNSSAVYVVCPDLLCGTRIASTHQHLLEDADIENRLFGRNKRFLRPSPFYPVYFWRTKRHVQNMSEIEDNDVDFAIRNRLKRYYEWRKKRAESRVVGGRPSQPASWPWMVALYRNGMFHCGGVVLTQRWVVSAAHCVHEFWDNHYEVQVGMLRRFSFSPQEQNHRVSHVIVNQNYDKVDMKNDLSLLRVEPSILFSRWVRPICLPGLETAGEEWLMGPKPGTLCTAVGWGATVEHGPDPDHMREVEVPVWDNCNHKEDRAGREICAGLVEGGKDACQGDSGGPLLCRNPKNSQQWYIAGIVSHGNGCAKKGEPGVYTRVSLFVKWIKHHTNSKSLPIIQPKQECPGFRCTTGILKCLPKKRVCDKVVDCLGGEDEINCNAMRSSVSTLDDNPVEKIISSVKNTNIKLGNYTETENRTQMRDVEEVKQENVTEKMLEISNISETTTETEITIETEITTETEKTTLITQITTIADTLDKNNKNQLQTTETSKSSSQESASSESEELMPVSNNIADDLNVETSPTTEQQESKRGDIDIIAISQEKPHMDSEAFIAEKRSEGHENDISDFDNGNNKATTDMSTMETDIAFAPDDNDQGTDLTTSESQSNRITASDIQTTESNSNSQEINNGVSTELTKETTTAKTLTTTSIEAITDNIPPLVSPSKDDMLDDKKLTIDLIENSLKTNTSKNLVPARRPPNKSMNASDSSETLSGKELVDDEQTIIDRIKDIVKSNLLPAKSKKKYNLPKHFECLRLHQIIPFKYRCDHKADCEDGTDEIGCACVDYITTFDQNFLCDGIVDCADGQDELDCYGCNEDQFLCKTSQMCLPLKHVCDGKSQCPHGEDELDCFALTNGKNIVIDFTGRPKVNLEGFLTQKHKKDWNIICEDNLSQREQEEAASHICRYLGFSDANKYHVKHINIKDSDVKQTDEDGIFIRRKRNSPSYLPIRFTYKIANDSDEDTSARSIVIDDPVIIKEKCLPNVTRTCMSLYVHCEQTLYTEFTDFDEDVFKQAEVNWPWNAKVFVEGKYRCTGILINLSWVLVSNACLWDAYVVDHYLTVVVGSTRVLKSTNGPYEQVYKVNSKIDLHHRKVTLLHLKEPAHYSPMVKPMDISSLSLHRDDKNSMCVAVGQDEDNSTISVFLDETDEGCERFSKCYVRHSLGSICPKGMVSSQPWTGMISCHGEDGWYPAATFTEKEGECGPSEKIIAYDIGNIKSELRNHLSKFLTSSAEHLSPSDKNCDGERCGRGICIPFPQVCDGINNCEDASDETDSACAKKKDICKEEPYHGGCECSAGQLKCKNGKCIAKELFSNGHDDCGDGSDEPSNIKCSLYLARTMPLRLCDGILHCHDRSDEDPEFCKCFSKRSYKCGGSEHCVAPDLVCDGTEDCPFGEDENTCLALSAPDDSPYGTGEVIQRSHGVWHTKCYPSPNHTRSELEDICRELGFISGHARQLNVTEKAFFNPRVKVVLDPFHDVQLNNITVVRLRNTDSPIAKAVKDDSKEACHPVFIECL